MNHRSLGLIAVALAISSGRAFAALPTLDFSNLPAYRQALDSSTDPQATIIRAEIAHGPANLKKELAAIKHDGISTNLKAFEPPVPPANKNAAPLWEALLGKRPILTGDFLGGYVAHFAYPTEILNDERHALAKHSQVIAAIHHAATRPYCYFTSDWDFSHDLSGVLGLGAQLRECARTIQLESCLSAREGNYTWAIDNDAIIFNMARQVSVAPYFADRFLMLGVHAIGVDGLRSILYFAGPNAPVDRQITEELAQIPSSTSLDYAMRRDVAYTATRDGVLRRMGSGAIARWWANNVGTAPTPLQTAADRKFARNLLDAQEADYLSAMRILVTTPLRYSSTQSTFTPFTNQNPVTSEMQAAARSIVEKSRRNTADARITLTMAEALLIKAKTGSFPDKLSHLYIDPYSGRALGYRRQGDGFVVTCAGKKDNGRTLNATYPLKQVPMPAFLLHLPDSVLKQ